MSVSRAGRILVADDEEDFRNVVLEHLGDLGYDARGAGDGRTALALAGQTAFDVALVDLRMPGMNGAELLEALKVLDPALEVIVITGHGTVETAIRTLKRGAYDYLLKPCRLAELEAVVSGAHEKRRLRVEGARLREQIRRLEPTSELLGDSAPMQQVRELIARAAPSGATVLILGETGTGKELAARALHRQSPRQGGSFVVMQAGAVPDSLLESELFGHVRGAYTGAIGPRQGLLELADAGTLFIDEIGEMTLSAQTKFLRILESPVFRPVGGEREVRVDVRFVAATNRDLRRLCAQGAFREDLYYRLNVMPIDMPPLRAHPEDIPLLVQSFLDHASWPLADRQIRPEALEAMAGYAWPGNVRELRNVLERALILSGGKIGPEHLPPELYGLQGAEGRALGKVPPSLDLEFVERQHILRVLGMTRGNKVEAARLLGLPRRTLYRRLERYGLPDPDKLSTGPT